VHGTGGHGLYSLLALVFGAMGAAVVAGGGKEAAGIFSILCPMPEEFFPIYGRSKRS
jgi:hypothetical protein